MALTSAQQSEVDKLKMLIGETTYTDDELFEFITLESGSVNGAAALVWEKKSAESAGLIDIREGSSSRNLSNVHKQAADRAAYFRSQAENETAVVQRVSRTRPIVRP